MTGADVPARMEFANSAKRFANRAAAMPAFPVMEACTVFAAGAAIVTGAFGTGAMPVGARSLFWLILMVINYAKWRLWIAWQVRQASDWPRAAVFGGIVLSLPLPFEIELAYRLVLGRSIDIPAQGVLLQSALLGLLILATVFWWINRSNQARSNAGDQTNHAAGPLHRAGIDPATVSALLAEDHYCRVITAGGTERLLLCRFGDAIGELGSSAGALARRGAWIADAAVVGLHRSGRSWTLELSCGKSVVVSASRRRIVRQRGWLSRR